MLHLAFRDPFLCWSNSKAYFFQTATIIYLSDGSFNAISSNVVCCCKSLTMLRTPPTRDNTTTKRDSHAARVVPV